jgi:hypothetical protein
MGHLLKIKCVDSRVNVNILAPTSVPFRPKTVQVPNLALTRHDIDNSAGFYVTRCHDFMVLADSRSFAATISKPRAFHCVPDFFIALFLFDLTRSLQSPFKCSFGTDPWVAQEKDTRHFTIEIIYKCLHSMPIITYRLLFSLNVSFILTLEPLIDLFY